MLWLRALLITAAIIGLFSMLPLLFYAIPYVVVFLIVVAVLKEGVSGKKPP
jgi:hypothetical protein